MFLSRRAALFSVFLAVAAFGTQLQSATAVAQGGFGDVTVTPTRLVLEGRTRSGTLSLANTGSKKATYRITVINMRMTETGAFQEIPEADPAEGKNFAEGLFRYAPRQITLEPGESQLIRVAARKPAGLAAGEYRSHLLIRAIPESGAGQSIEKKPGEGLEISLAVIPGVALPIIVRHGELSAQASISDIAISPASAGDQPKLDFRLNRTGNASLYGDLSATYFAPDSDEGVLIGEVNQLAVYTPNSHRLVTMQLILPEGLQLKSGGRITVGYRTPPKEGGKTIAAAEITLD
jgi:hypothetical protein